MKPCEFCNETMRGHTCPSCDIYNAAIAAQYGAAKHIAESWCDEHNMNPGKLGRHWLNEHGVFVFYDGVAMQIANAAMARPFSELTTAARLISDFSTEFVTSDQAAPVKP